MAYGEPIGEQLALDLSGLSALGLAAGDRVRFRPRPNARWREGTVAGLHPDGSVGLHDADGRARAIRPSALEVRRAGPRGGLQWAAVG